MDSRRRIAKALERRGPAAAVAGWAALAPETARAFHESLGLGGGAPVHVLLLIATAVAVLLVALARWQPRKRGRKPPRSPARPAGKRRKRRGEVWSGDGYEDREGWEG